MKENQQIRNVAIIAHVDHGKTTIIDQLFKCSGAFNVRKEVEDRVLDNLELEKERGITIAAKNCSINWNGVKINILDTPGHADFGGEVERALMMVDGVILLVDASEGPLPQTRFVLRKALERGLPAIVIVNKIDRTDARPAEVLDEVYDLFIDLDSTEEQLEFPIFYAVGRQGIAKRKLEEEDQGLDILLDCIVEYMPGPRFNPEEPFQLLVTNLTYSDFLGRLAVGRVMHGEAKRNDALQVMGEKEKVTPLRVSKLQAYEGTKIVEIEQATPGDIVLVAGVNDIKIGDTICTRENPKALKRITVDEPTILMAFSANTSPLSGTEGKFVQSTRILERLEREALHNVALKIEANQGSEVFTVKGRGEFQLAILIESMRREGFELTVGRPQTIFKEEDGITKEPVEQVFIDCNEEYLGVVSEELAIRKGKMVNLVNHGTGRIRAEFVIPSRGLIGYRSKFLTDTRGTGVLNTYFSGFQPYFGDIRSRGTGSLVSDRRGESVPYALFHLEPRGRLFIGPGVKVYEGMIVGEHNRENDLNVNVCKTKKLTNVRASGKDEAVVLTPVVPLSLEQAIEFIKDDELLEVTPKSLRLRKRILAANRR